MAVGAAGGILIYRRGRQVMAEARERGVVPTVQQAAVTAATTVATVRTAVQSARTGRT